MKCPHCHEEFPLHVKHSRTSKAAGEARVYAMKGTRLRILRFLSYCAAIGATDEEMQSALRLNPNTQRPRRVELCAMAAVVDSGDTRPTSSGANATVWIAAPTPPTQGVMFP